MDSERLGASILLKSTSVLHVICAQREAKVEKVEEWETLRPSRTPDDGIGREVGFLRCPTNQIMVSIETQK